MDRNRVTRSIGSRVSRAILAAGVDTRTVAQAADITTPDLLDRLEGRAEFVIDELVAVGGFLRTPVSHFLGGAA